MAEVKIGTVTHYFGHLGVAAVAITEGELKIGDSIRIQGHTSDFTQRVDSIQLEHEQIQCAGPGQNVGIHVDQHAREHDQVFKIVAE